jgi:hypothetical protein
MIDAGGFCLSIDGEEDIERDALTVGREETINGSEW